jgi:hypothetical protein
MVVPLPHNEWLDDPLLSDRIRQLPQTLRGKILSRLKWAGVNAVQGNLLDAIATINRSDRMSRCDWCANMSGRYRRLGDGTATEKRA